MTNNTNWIICNSSHSSLTLIVIHIPSISNHILIFFSLRTCELTKLVIHIPNISNHILIFFSLRTCEWTKLVINFLIIQSYFIFQRTCGEWRKLVGMINKENMHVFWFMYLSELKLKDVGHRTRDHRIKQTHVHVIEKWGKFWREGSCNIVLCCVPYFLPSKSKSNFQSSLLFVFLLLLISHCHHPSNLNHHRFSCALNLFWIWVAAKPHV